MNRRRDMGMNLARGQKGKEHDATAWGGEAKKK